MSRNMTPLIKSTNNLILAGGAVVAISTLLGMMSNPHEVIESDVRYGPMIAAAKVLIPLFLTIGAVYMLSRAKKCKKCGKIFFWRRPDHS